MGGRVLTYRSKELYQEALAKGIEQGIEQGIEDKSKEVVINMLNKNMDYETISEISGKTIEEIKEIENDINSL